MPNLLTLSRAARLVGTTRGELQQRIRRNELETFEGKVRASDLLRAFPEAKLEDDSALDRVNRIRTSATPEREPKYELPSPQVLAGRVNVLSHELTDAKAELANYTDLMSGLSQRLEGLGDVGDDGLRAEIKGVRAWLEEQMQKRPQVPKRKAELLARDTFLRMLAAQVQVIPSGHEFFVEGTDTILNAALHSGLAVKYGCTSGSCGSCKARVVTGRVLKVRDHEYDISPTEREMGYVLMCSYTAVTDLMIEASEAKGGGDIPDQQIDAEVRRLARASGELAILHVKTPKTSRLRFLAGQGVRLELASGESQELPLACCPCDGQNLELHIHRRKPTPFVKAVFGGGIEPGESIRVTGPLGESLTDLGDASPMLFIVHEDGFANLKGFIENAISTDEAAAFHLVWVTAEGRGRYMDNLCRSWSDALENFSYFPVVTGGDVDGEEAGSLTDAVLARISGIDDCQVYLAGPADFNAVLVPILERRGVERESLQVRETG